MKQILIKLLAVLAIIVIIVSPYFLIIDFAKYSPFVLSVWLICAAYFVFVKSRSDRNTIEKSDSIEE